jgi:hypothetical protein
VKAPSETGFRRAAHRPAVTARVGTWLGITFTVCFVTGLFDHFVQYPPGWFFWPSRPVNLFRITQGLHIICGIAAIPLLIAKLWSVFPKLFARPVVRSPVHAIERGSILLLSGAAFFQLATGLFNATQNYPWKFLFTSAHYAVAWVAIGSIAVHVAVKLPIIRNGLAEKPKVQSSPAEGLSRRGFLRTTWLATGVAVVATAGGTVPFLRDVSVLANRSADAPQGLPVNKTAAAAGVRRDPEYRLRVNGPRPRTFSLAELRAMPQTTAGLPIACVEGWSAGATWTGVPVADLLRLAGAEPGTPVRVRSIQTDAAYTVTELPGEHTSDPLTLLALRLNGEELSLDHGFPCRIIAPSRPGVLQTKWVQSLEVI